MGEITFLYFSCLPSSHALGPAVTIENIANSFSNEFGITIITMNFDYTLETALFSSSSIISKEDKIRRIYLPKRISRYVFLYKYFSTYRGGIAIHCLFDYRLALPALLILRWLLFSDRPVLHFPHGIFMPAVFDKAGKRLRNRLYCRFLEYTGLLKNAVHVASSEYEKNTVLSAFRTRQAIEVVPWLADPPRSTRSAVPKRRGELRLCSIGRITSQKNFLFAIDILSELDFPCRFDIYGSTVDTKYYRQCLDRLALLTAKTKVNFFGNVDRDELFERLPGYDLLFFPTQGENFGHAIIEALGLGVPALLSDQTPWDDLDQHGAGWTFPLADRDAFKRVLKTAYEAGPEWDKRRGAAKEYARVKTNPEVARRRFRELFAGAGN